MNPHSNTTQKNAFSYKYKKRKEKNYILKNSRTTTIIKQPKSRMMLPKRVECYEDVIKRLFDSKSSNYL